MNPKTHKTTINLKHVSKHGQIQTSDAILKCSCVSIITGEVIDAHGPDIQK